MTDTTFEPEANMGAGVLPNRSAMIAKLATALAAAQKGFAPIPKNKAVTVRSKRGEYKFKYATLDSILSATLPALADQGLSLVQAIVHDDNGNPGLETTLYHSSGEWLRNVTPMFISGRRTEDGHDLPPSNQELGSSQSYARRYGISALLCVAADEDDDGNIADGDHIENSHEVPYKPRQSSAAGRRLAAEEPHLADHNRAKGSLKPEPAKADGKSRARDWADARIQELNAGQWDKPGLEAYWDKHNTPAKDGALGPIDWIKENAPAEYERLETAYLSAEASCK